MLWRLRRIWLMWLPSFAKSYVLRVKAFIADLKWHYKRGQEEGERARRRKEVGNRCSDIFCLDDPCRNCPNKEYHHKKWPHMMKENEMKFGDGYFDFK
jgi:hypothetical protein